MAYGRRDDLQAFLRFVAENLESGGEPLTLDDALDLWDDENQDEEEREASLRAIREGLADVEAGRVRPAREALAVLRRKFHMPELP